MTAALSVTPDPMLRMLVVSAVPNGYPATAQKVATMAKHLMYSSYYLVLLVLAMIAPAKGQTSDAAYSLTVHLNSRYNRDVVFCTSVRVGEPFYLELTADAKSTVISGRLNKSESGVFPLTLAVKEGAVEGGSNHSTSERINVKLGLAKQRFTLFALHDEAYQEVLLTTEVCPGKWEPDPDKW